MNEIVRFSLVALVVFLTHFQQGITGFGCTMLSLPFVALLLGLLGVIIGNHVHYRTDAAFFRKIVYTVLIISGVVFGWSALYGAKL